MPRQRPGAVTAAATLAIIYGSLFTLCNLCGVGTLVAQGAMKQNMFGGGNDPQQAQMQKQMEDAMDRDVPLYRATQIISPIVGLVFAIAVLAAGIGLLGMHSWARLLAIVAVGFIVLFNMMQTMYQLVFVLPAMNRVFADVLPNAMAKGPAPVPPQFMQVMQGTLVAAAVIGMLIQLAVIVYLLIIVFLLMRHNVRTAFAGGNMPEEARDEPDRDEEDEAWSKPAPRPKPEDDFRIQ